MRKGMKILCLVATVFFLLTGAASATLLSEITFKYGSTPWATLNIDLEGVSGDWTYTYTLSVLSGPGTAGVEVHELDIPVISETVVPPGYTNVQTVGGEAFSFSYETVDNGILYLVLGGYELAAGEFTKVSFDSPYDPSSSYYYIWNGAQSPAIKAMAAVGDLGGGNSSVPEPATLILVGIGILGVGAYRHLSARGRV